LKRPKFSRFFRRSAPVILCLAISVSACDLSPFLPKPTSNNSNNNSSPISSWAYNTTSNPALAMSYIGTVNSSSNLITVQLPQSVLSAGTALTPTIGVAAGYSITPSGSFVPTSGMTITAKGPNSVNYTLVITPTTGPILSFAYLSSNNPSLTQNYTAALSGNSITVLLPQTVIQSGTSLTPTVSLTSGYSMSPSGAFVPTNGMSIVITNTSTGATANFLLLLSSLSSSPLQSFAYLTTNNPSLTQNCAGIVSASSVSVQLPQSVISAGTALTPTVNLMSGYTIAPGGSYVPINGIALTVTCVATGATTSFTLLVTAIPPSNILTSYAFLTSNNQQSLPQNYVGTISGTTISIEVPYSIIQNQTPLTPTVGLQSGYTINPTGAYYPNNGMTLAVTCTSTGVVSNYTLDVSVDPGTLAFLQLSNPFYYSDTGIKTSLTSAQYNLVFNGPTNTYSLTFNTDAFTVPYNVTIVQQIVTTQPVGFTTVTVPYGSFTTNLAAAVGGAACPYTVAVESSAKTVTNTFTIQAARTKSNIVQLSDVSATIGYLYNTTTTQALTDNTLQNFLSAMWGPQPADSYTENGSQTTEAEFQQFWSVADGPVWPSNSAVYTTTGSSWTDGADNAYLATSQGQINTNVAAINGILAAPVHQIVVNSTTTIDLGSSYTISSEVTAPSVTNATSPLNKPLPLASTLSVTLPMFAITFLCNDSQTLSVPVTQTTAYTATGYVQFQQIVVKLPLYNTIQQVAPSTLVQTWSQSQNSTDYVLTFNMVLQTSHVTGVVAQLQIAAESGTVSTYSIAIN